MPGNARRDIVRRGEIGTYHCWSRCVQKAYLCGMDPETNKDFSYRRGWIESLLLYLAGVFALDVGNYNVLTNHTHVILRTRPDIAATWSAEELALRWKMAWPEFIDGQWVREPTEEALNQLLVRPDKIEQIRKNLSSLSWLMARWKEPIAKLCNGEMDRRGHFWEARFGSRELLDSEAVLTCSMYVDLNQLRAGMANSFEDSHHSAIRNRLLAAQCLEAQRREAQASREAFAKLDSADAYAFPESEAQALFADCLLAPIGTDGPLLTAASLPRIDLSERTAANAPVRTAHNELQPADQAESIPIAESKADVVGQSAVANASQQPQGGKPSGRRTLTRRRASDSPILDVPWSEYLRVLQGVAQREGLGTVAMAVAGSHDDLSATLEAWGMVPEPWLASISQLDRQCRRALGTAEHVLERVEQAAQRWFHGLGLCREIFVTSNSDEFT